MKYEITGGKKLKGEIKVSGNKNSILPCMAATLLTTEEVILENVPQISDVDVFVQILESLGAKVLRQEHKLTISASETKNTRLPEELSKKVRASLCFVGSLLHMGKVYFTHPGGDVIGKRSISAHLQGFKDLGVKIEEDGESYTAQLPNDVDKNRVNIFLEEPSQTGTSNLVLASVLGEREVILRNCAKEPSNIDLCKMLNSMGANIEGIGTDTLIIHGVSRLSGTGFRVSDDISEIGTYSIAAALIGENIKIICHSSSDLEPIFVVLDKFGIKFKLVEDGFLVDAGELKSVEVVKTNVWPGFPTDLMSVLIVLATQAKGITLCHDWMYESRMFFVDKLITMGAKITIADPHRVLVYGPTKLRGRVLETPDIRAGMSLVLAALIAEGKSTINSAELIERGYEDVVGKLSNLGADIRRID